MGAEQNIETCEKADRIAAEYAATFEWADYEALKLYFRLELVNDTLREIAASLHEGLMPGAKGWSVAVLRALYMSPEHRLSHAEIGMATRVPPANVTYHVDVLQHGGYVTRRAHESDRRVTLVELTEKGREACERLMPARTRFISQLARQFTEDEKFLFNDLLGRLQQAMKSDALDPSGAAE